MSEMSAVPLFLAIIQSQANRLVRVSVTLSKAFRVDVKAFLG